MRKRVEAAEGGQSVEKLIPVNVPPTKEYGTKLKSRLTFLRERIVPECFNDAKS